MLSIGVIGTGWVATDRYLPALARHPQVSYLMVCDRTKSKAATVAAHFDAVSCGDDVEQFFNAGLDAVFVCTPPWLHPELSIRALRSGSHVFTEKPMALTLADAQKMARVAADMNRVLCVSHNFLYSNSVMKAAKWIERDGSPRFAIGLQASNPRRRLPTWLDQLPGGLMLDESPHLLYTLQSFIGSLELSDARVVWGENRIQPQSVELRLAGSRGIGQITMLFEAPVSEWHLGLVTERSVIDLDLFRDIAIRVGNDGSHKAADIARTSLKAIGGHVAGFVAAGTRYATKRQAWGHDVIIGLFIEAIQGRGPTPVPLDESLNVVKVTDAILAEVLAS